MTSDILSPDAGKVPAGPDADKAKKKKANPHAGHRDKLRRRFLTEGLQNFEPHNALELLLFYAIPQKDTNETAHLLIEHFGSLSEVFNAPYDELIKIKGLSEYSASLICLIPQMMRMYARDIAARDPISGRDDISSYIFSQLVSEQVEKVLLVTLDNNGTMLACDCISTGSLESTPLDMRTVVSTCISRNATAVILAHNHPRGQCCPSSADVSVTTQLRQALDTIYVRLLDHMIVSSERAFSMCSDERYRHIFRRGA